MKLKSNNIKSLGNNELKMYNVFAYPHTAKKDDRVRPCILAKTYKRISAADKFVEDQKNHPRFYFEITTQQIQ